MLQRHLRSRLLQAAGNFPIVVLSGPIGSGKSSLVKSSFDYPLISMKDFETRSTASSDPIGFLTSHLRHQGQLVIDDIHLAQHLLPTIGEIAKQRQTAGTFILILSKAIDLTPIADLATDLHLLSTTLGEQDEERNKSRSLDELLFRGSYPSVIEDESIRSDYYSKVLQSFFELELPKQIRLARPESFMLFTKLCAGRIGQMVNYSRLGDDCGVSHNTIRIWMKVLIDNYLAFLLPPHQSGHGRRMVKTPKLYFYDTGIAAALLGIKSPAELETHYLRGTLFESMVISDLQKETVHQGLDRTLYFWRDKLGAELDCVIEEEGRLLPIEIKAGKTVSASYFEGINGYNALSKGKPENCSIVYGGDDNHSHPMSRLVSWRSIPELSKAAAAVEATL